MIDQLIAILCAQRNNAMDEAAKAIAENILYQRKIEELEVKIKELENGLPEKEI